MPSSKDARVAQSSATTNVSVYLHKKKKGKAFKDLNMPRKPANAFFVFMEFVWNEVKGMKKEIKDVAAVSLARGDKWKTMSEEEKAPFYAEAERRKAEYVKRMLAYHKSNAKGHGIRKRSENGC